MHKKETMIVEMDITIDDVFRFCRIRETIRKNKEQDINDWYSGLEEYNVSDQEIYILKNSRMNNIFRDHDKVTKILWNKVQGLEGRDLWRNLLIGRYINRYDRISEVFPLMTDDWFNHVNWTSDTQMFNSLAYQIHPGIGRLFGVKGVRETVPLLHTKITPTFTAIEKSNTIKDATNNANEAFGGYLNFMMFQCAIDYACLQPHKISPKSECIVGEGAHATFKALNMGLEDVASQARQLWPEHLEIRPDGLYEFDVENIMCEFRKFKQRQRDGIPTTRQYGHKKEVNTLDSFFG